MYLPYENRKWVKVLWYPYISTEEIEAIRSAKAEDVQKILSIILQSPLK